MAERVTVTARSGEATCGYCRQPLGGAPVECPACRVGMHPGCRTELARCPTLGCVEASAPRRRRRRRYVPARGWGWPAVAFSLLPVVVGLALLAVHRYRVTRAEPAPTDHEAAHELESLWAQLRTIELAERERLEVEVRTKR